MENQTTVTEFFLLGFSDVRELQILHCVVFLCIYLIAMTGNVLIVITIVQNHNLHSPMYFFLANLSFLDASYISTIVPKSIVSSVLNDQLIPFSECITQAFWVITFATTELFILTVMAYDRYVAICHPLQYNQTMNQNACFQLAAASWACSVFIGVAHTAAVLRLDFCSSNIVEQFFCDIPQLLMLSCTDTAANNWLLLALASFAGSFCFLLILFSYSYIFYTVFQIQSVQARYKAFSTCIPHLIIYSFFITTAVFVYLRPKALSSLSMNLLSAVLYTVLPPLMNPIVYSLRNKEIKVTLIKMLTVWLEHIHLTDFSEKIKLPMKRELH